MDARTRLLLEGPVGSSILRLSLPNVIVMAVQTSIGLIETYFVAKLGLDALAGMALVFPLYMLLQMVTAGAIGGGILSAVARALGSGRRERANDLVWYAVAITIVLGALTTVATLLFAPRLYALMGGRDGSLAAATTYSAVVFAGTIPLWLFNSFAAIIRGTGNMLFPATVITVGAFVLIPLSPALIFGLGPFPQLGIAGGAAAVVLYYAIGCAVFAAYLWSGRGVLKASLDSAEARLGADARHSSGRRRFVRGQLVDQYLHRNRDRPRGFGRPRRRRRLWHRRATGIFARTASVRSGYSGSGHGRHLYWRRPPGSSLAGCMDRCGACRRHHRSHRARCGLLSIGMAVIVRE